MSQEVPQWIAEIKALREQVAQAQRDRDTAIDTATKWSELYNREAEQRRAEAKLSQEMIQALKAEIHQLKAGITLNSDENLDLTAISQEVENLQSVELLREKLIAVTIERDRLTKALKAEQESHTNTRQSLTIALSDTVDLLTKQQRGEIITEKESKVNSEKTKAETAKLTETAKTPVQLPMKSKNPSLQLPPTRPAPPRA